MKLELPKWQIQELTGYIPQTTFWTDFSIADKFGLEAIEDTFNRAFNEWKDNIIYLTELTMVINHKCWEHYHRSLNELKQFTNNHEEISRWYANKYEWLMDWGYNNLNKQDLNYFYKTLD